MVEMDHSLQALTRLPYILLCLSLVQNGSEAFQALSVVPRTIFTPSRTVSLAATCRRTLVVDEVKETNESLFDPCGLAAGWKDCLERENDVRQSKITKRDHVMSQYRRNKNKNQNISRDLGKKTTALAGVSSLALLSLSPEMALAAAPRESPFSATLDPATFQPVCPTSDGFYRFLQYAAESVVGYDNAKEYGPLIAGGLLRVRLELCVVESFFNEAVGPFIERNGWGWILPIRETVESFIAGTVFAFAATFILIGSTKIITVIVTYADFLLGIPSRLFGGFFYDRALGKPVTLDIGLGPFKTRVIGPPPEEEISRVDLSSKGPIALLVIGVSGIVKLVGLLMGVIREVIDAIDVFVGRYLVVWATGYVLIKFLHFKIFPDFPAAFLDGTF